MTIRPFRRFALSLIALAWITTADTAVGQTPARSPHRFHASLRVLGLELDSAGHVIVSYRALNSPESTDSLSHVNVDAPTRPLRVSRPDRSWITFKQFVTRPL